MTTFTMQDLTNIPVTKEEDEAMDILSTPLPEPPTPPTLDEIVQNICTQLQLLATVIKEGQGKSSDGNPSQSLQECVSTTLQQAEWFKEVVEEKIDDMDFDYQIESAVETHFSNSFCLDDHVDITAEVESKVENIAEEMLRDMVEEKFRSLRITFD